MKKYTIYYSEFSYYEFEFKTRQEAIKFAYDLAVMKHRKIILYDNNGYLLMEFN